MHDTNHQSRIANHVGYEIRENDMLENKTTYPTVGAASAAIAGLVLTAGLLLTPSTTLADDECGAQVDSGNPETFSCSDPNYNSGVTYTTDGDLTLNFDNAGSPARSNIGGVGISVTGVGSDDVTIDSASTATELDSAGATGALVGVTTLNGNIVIGVEELDADFAPTTHGIFAQSTGTGSIDIATTGSVDAASGTNPANSIGIEAITNSGDIDLITGATVAGNGVGIRAVSAGGDVSVASNGNLFANGGQYGIQAATGGAGTLDISVSGRISLGLDNDNAVAIDATTGTGLLTIDIASGSGSISGSDGTTIRTDAGGDVMINIASGRTVTSSSGTVMDLTAAGEITVNNAGGMRVVASSGGAVIRATGESLTLNNDGGIGGELDFSNLSGDYLFNNSAGATWEVDTSNNLGAGVFNNAGTIEFGLREAVLAPGTAFTGTGDSTLEIVAALNVAGQGSCLAPATASCLDLTGGSTAGQTQILIDKADPNGLDPKSGLTQAANPGVLLVDVSGGTSDADHFVLHPDSEDYTTDPRYGAVIDTGEGGLLDYALLYNPNTQQHGLATVPQQEGVEYVSFIQEALSIWHTTSNAVAGRQADLRGGAVGGGWVRAISEQTERDSVAVLTTHGNTFTYEQDYTVDTWSAIGGYDLTSSDNHVIGLHGGFVYSTLEYDNSNTGTRDKIKGATMGAYAGWWNEAGLTLDGTLNTNFLRLKHNIREGFERSASDVRSIGVRAEAGWLWPLAGEAFFVQPLVTAAYVRSNIELLELRQNKLRFEDEESRRAALGVRLGGDMDLSGNRFGHLKYWLTARAWEEYAEDASVNYLTEGDPLTIEDDISESFEEVGLGVSLSSPDDKLNVFLSGGLQSGDQTDSTNVTIGVRMNW